jgi:hypothetical protein
MPRFDAQVEVVCDQCETSEFWTPEFSYSDWGGADGSYDTSDFAFAEWCKREKWAQDGDKTICEGCRELEGE